MKKITLIVTTVLFSITNLAFAQTPQLKESKVGHTFMIGLPDYMSKTVGLNTAASVQFKSTVKDVYGFVIIDLKEELDLAELKYSTVEEYFNSSFSDFFKGEKNVKMSEAHLEKKGELNFIEKDVTYYSKDIKGEIYYFIGALETKTAYYRLFTWSLASNKDKFKQDFQAILYSIHE